MVSLNLAFLPEIVLFGIALIALLIGTFASRSTWTFAFCQLGLLAVAGLILFQSTLDNRIDLTGNLLIDDLFASFAKLIMTLGAFFVCLLSEKWLYERQLHRIEFPILIVLSLLGMFVMVSANHLLTVYVGLELQSLALYALTAFAREDRNSAEAGIKYFVLGSLSSGLLLFGISLIYGATGYLDYDQIILQPLDSPLAITGIIFLLVGVGFKLSAAPFHMWTPDAYEGAPTPTTAFLAIVPKMAAFCLGLRLFYNALLPAIDTWQPLFATLAVLSMLIGSLGALMQTDIKRLLAYSTIGHAGFILIGVTAASANAIEATLVYLAIYVVMTLGLFAFVIAMQRDQNAALSIHDLKGLVKTHPASAFFLLLLLFSTAGIPPLAGFFAKFYIFVAAIEQGFIALVVIGVIASCIAAFYYIRLIGLMFFDDNLAQLDPIPTLSGVITALAAVLAVTFILFQSGLLLAAQLATSSMFTG